MDQSSSEILLIFAESWMPYVGGRASASVSSALEWSLRDFIFSCLEDAVRVATGKQADW